MSVGARSDHQWNRKCTNGSKCEHFGERETHTTVCKVWWLDVKAKQNTFGVTAIAFYSENQTDIQYVHTVDKKYIYVQKPFQFSSGAFVKTKET